MAGPPLPAGGPLGPRVVTRQGSNLMLNGQPHRFTGINAFQLATDWSVNAGCGTQVAEMDEFFASLRPNSMVRFWAFQSMATNTRTGAPDFSAIDRVVQAAERNGQHLVLTLSNQSGTCDDAHWRDQAWYDGGYMRAWNDDGRNLAPLSYWDWMRTVVARYRTSPAVGIWELVNEPEPSNCPGGARGDACYPRLTCPPGANQSLRRFFDQVGGELKRIDPVHPLASGVIGSGQCGMRDGGFSLVHASPAIDVATFHDYGHDAEPVPQALGERLREAQALGKPLVDEEVGMNANATGPCTSLSARRDLMSAKMNAGFSAGISGFMAWVWNEGDRGTCNHGLFDGDPVLSLLREARP